jgi:hypothetical protein
MIRCCCQHLSLAAGVRPVPQSLVSNLCRHGCVIYYAVQHAGGRSLELRGNSEYIPISDRDSDVIGGAQLEKLLQKSRQVRY